MPHLHPFARVNYRTNGRKFGILCGEDRRRHVYVVGKTGSGKTALMLNLIASDLRAGHGLAVLDPHGEQVNRGIENNVFPPNPGWPCAECEYANQCRGWRG